MSQRKGSPGILIAAEDPTHRQLLTDAVRHLRQPTRIESYTRPLDAIASAQAERPEIAILDVESEIADTLMTLRSIRASGSRIPVVLICRKTPCPDEVADLGPLHVLPKPYGLSDLRGILGRALPGPSPLVRRNGSPTGGAAALAEDGGTGSAPREDIGGDPFVFGNSPAILHILEEADRIAADESTILIGGGIGSGKTTFARYLHTLSGRRNGPFVDVSCGAFPEQLVESELFGHEKDAFTGAGAARPGKFELARGGTIFLDDIQNLTQTVQAKLLRVLQEKIFERVGGTRTLTADVRIIAATNRNLAQMVEEGSFREDLFWRLNVLEIDLPPLSERREDIPFLVEAFVKKFAKSKRKTLPGVSPQLLDTLVARPWPGNVRELSNAIERLVTMSKGKDLDPRYLPRASGLERLSESAGGNGEISVDPNGIRITDAEIKHALAATKGNRTKTAELLKISRGHLHRLMRQRCMK